MPFADQLIGPEVAADLVQAVRAAAPAAPLSALNAAQHALTPLPLRERSDLLRDALITDLPGDYDHFAGVVRAARDASPLLRGWMIWPVTSAVAAKAIAEGTEEAFDDALALLADLTSRLSSEFAIRALLDHDLDRALTTIQGWTAAEDVDVRRLASEGTRPFLPWATRVAGILEAPHATLPILTALYRDESDYVRRSVANHLNDLSREQPELVVATAAEWLADPDENTEYVVRHGLRTLVKKGDADALRLLGFGPATVDVTGPDLTEVDVPFGGTVSFAATIRNTGPEQARLVIDYIVHHTKADGRQTGKTFKLTTKTLESGESVDIARDHSFREITTRRYHPGAHAIELQINGVRSGRADFMLLPGD
ncbi:DNA alkylation repair protein [Actinoalloteichus sp. GBA129-24]|uniref:DNA alkylation repair protein n=1 Tax=Actinoalloteichus sp. GBA129-24 TaxID=1612551 RepID=UPI00095087CD|nr:DNA alkylation repair protein [Actinoalloteichus sp. GBA129-24]APU22001.1 DNA alkylation repair enzyme [Actinoalloteichus sp. GBA129-24]